MDITITKGFAQNERARVAALYWEAFGAKLSSVMGPQDRALSFIAGQLNPRFALIARDIDGVILGVAGFKTAEGALVGGGLRDLARTYGWLSTLWRAPLLAMVERDLADGVLLMDGICVTAEARGHGLGTKLLDAIKHEAARLNLSSVRLDVINTNPRARALYERQGFRALGQEQLGPLRHVFGFSSASKMIFP
ncbi:MAG: GNAT family N-acetyltransferase [Sulfitobacter sp.]